MEICFATSNLHKLEEAEKILGFPLKQASIDIPEIQSLDVKKVAEDKARKAYEILKRPVIAEDTGLYLKGWGGFPGAFVAWVVNTMGVEKFCNMAKGQEVTAMACVAYHDGTSVMAFCGRIKGRIADKPMGRKRFDWDRIFIPAGETRTFAQMKLVEKNRISHRTKAFRKLKKYIKSSSSG
jgi:XTP/dITP diphosphohydrolase